MTLILKLEEALDMPVEQIDELKHVLNVMSHGEHKYMADVLYKAMRQDFCLRYELNPTDFNQKYQLLRVAIFHEDITQDREGFVLSNN